MKPNINPNKPKPKFSIGSFVLFATPLLVTLAVGYMFFYQLNNKVDNLPSVLIGQAAPDFDLPQITDLVRDGIQIPGFSTASLKGPLPDGKTISVINIFASWCVPCRAEHPFITQLGNDPRIQLIGLNYDDAPDNATAFLNEVGNPYDLVGADRDRRIGFQFGVYGVPETFIIDVNGNIAHKYVGPLDGKILAEILMPAIEEVLAGG